MARKQANIQRSGGTIVPILPGNGGPELVADRIFRSLASHAEVVGRGAAYTHETGFVVPELPSGRDSFSPDVAYFAGPVPAGPVRLVAGPPTFAVEIRGARAWGPVAETDRAARRADYFEAGTLAIWDVDLPNEVILLYRAQTPDQPIHFTRGQQADAEPAVPRWRVNVAWVFG
jgi:Uma2 family endonuclease